MKIVLALIITGLIVAVTGYFVPYNRLIWWLGEAAFGCIMFLLVGAIAYLLGWRPRRTDDHGPFDDL